MEEKPTTVEDVFREHIAFLRDQLEGKKLWCEQILEAEKEVKNKLRLERDQLKVALGRVYQELLCHNSQEDNPHETENSLLELCLELIG